MILVAISFSSYLQFKGNYMHVWMCNARMSNIIHMSNTDDLCSDSCSRTYYSYCTVLCTIVCVLFIHRNI